MEILELCFRNQSVFMTKDDITGLTDEDWFLKVILNWNEGIKIDINEDKDTAMSLIESLRYNKLIVYPDVSLDYLNALADKWCMPKNIKELINERMEKNINLNTPKNKEVLLCDNIVFTCNNCGVGFKQCENTNKSCVCHPKPFDVNVVISTFRCCGGLQDSHPCRNGYHVITSGDRERYLKLRGIDLSED